jgi:hypothetical protein
VDLLNSGIHLMILDLWPPGPLHAFGMHDAIWRHFDKLGYEPPFGKSLTFASHDAGDGVTAYVQPAAIGDKLPVMPLFLLPGLCVDVPLPETYATAFGDIPPEALGALA